MTIFTRFDDSGLLVDKLGELQAEIDALSKQQKVLQDEIVLSGLPHIEGDFYRAVIFTHTRESLNGNMVKFFLTPEQFLQCTKVHELTKVRVYAKIRLV